MTGKTTLRCSRVRCWTGWSSPAALRCSPVQRTSVKHTVVVIPRHTFPSYTMGTNVARHVCAGVQIMLSVSARLSKKQGINTARRGQQEARRQGKSRHGGKQPRAVLWDTCVCPLSSVYAWYHVDQRCGCVMSWFYSVCVWMCLCVHYQAASLEPGIFVRAASTNPKIRVRDHEYQESGYQLSLLTVAFCFRLCGHSHRKDCFVLHLLPKMSRSRISGFSHLRSREVEILCGKKEYCCCMWSTRKRPQNVAQHENSSCLFMLHQ